MRIKRNIIEIDEELCNGCGECVPDCAEGSLEIVNGKARLVADKLCDGLGACLGSCPTGALKIVEREAEEFDEEAVERYLEAREAEEAEALRPSCPSAGLQHFAGPTPCQQANRPLRQEESSLGHWPVQIRLIPAHAPFLEQADLVIAADCTAVAYAGLQQEFIRNKIVMMGCPKFDDQELYVKRFTEIFSTRNLRSLTVLIMEVPCCSAMLQILHKARQAAGSNLPLRKVVISTKGAIVEDTLH